MEFAIIDIETTGSAHLGGKITEIAIVISDGKKVLNTYETLINPESKIPYFISKLTGIDDKMVAGAPKFYEVAKEVLRLTEGKVFVAHNASFDYGFFKKEFKDLGFEYERKTICTVKTARKVFPGLPSYSLGKIAAHFGIPIKARHRAMGDAAATAVLFHKMLQEDPMFINDLKFNNHLTDHLKVNKIPNEPGIYYFKNKAGEIIYIGKSKRLKNRVRTHLNNFRSKKGIKIIQEINEIDYKLTGTEIMALLYENMEIKTHKPIYNRAQRNTIFPVGVFIDKSQPYHKLFVSRVNKMDQPPVIGFKSSREAKNRLIKWTEKYELCERVNELDNTSKTSACFAHRLEKCKGACIGEETAEDYNKRVKQFELDMGITQDNFIFTHDGIKKNQKAFVLVLSGMIEAFGFAKSSTNFSNIDQLRLLSENFQTDKDFQRVLKHLLNDKRWEQIKLPSTPFS